MVQLMHVTQLLIISSRKPTIKIKSLSHLPKEGMVLNSNLPQTFSHLDACQLVAVYLHLLISLDMNMVLNTSKQCQDLQMFKHIT